ncbi:Coiled-coil domain-containing protein 102A [Nymphon striatum]|nr:Coiled-coil domain-containing protein 102A [Nymphon striatum]
MTSHAGDNSSSLQNNTPSTSSHQRQGDWSNGDISRDHHNSYHGSHHHSQQSFEPEWEAKEELRLRELDEARARAAQMEKTMRWWSDCTANWREKWSKVRSERNKAREEARVFRAKLDSVSKECNNIKRDKQELESFNEELRRELEQLKSLELTHLDGAEGIKSITRLNSANDHIPEKDTNANAECVNCTDVPGSRPNNLPDHLQSGNSVEKSFNEETRSFKQTETKHESRKKLSSSTRCDVMNLGSLPSPEHERAEQRVAMLQLKLDEATKTIQAEREDKSHLNRTIEKLHEEMNLMKTKYDDIKQSKQDILKELNQLKSEHQDELDSMRIDLEDEANGRSSMEERLADLRSELERMQAENASEWGKRERLETEKLAIERENKKLKTHIEDLEERLERRSKQISSTSDTDVKSLQVELNEKNKEIGDLRHSHNKLKKIFQEKSTELAHTNRRGEQYESEVKKLRSRVEELKKELAVSEDEIDTSTNSVRRLQRSNDELQEQVDSVTVQVDHLQTRLRNSNHSLMSSRRGSNNLLNDQLSDGEATE